MRSRLPPLNSLRLFEASARLLSFKNAAEELLLTPRDLTLQVGGGTPQAVEPIHIPKRWRASWTELPTEEVGPDHEWSGERL